MKLRHIDNPGWKLIAELGWGTWTTDYMMINKYLFKTLDITTLENLRSFVKGRVAKLYNAVEKWEDDHEHLDIGSDDGFSDVVHHVIGLGEAEFKRVMADLTLLEKRYNAPYNTPEGYRESFAYCFYEPDDKL